MFHGKPLKKPFVPESSLPLPLKQIFGYPWPVATPKSRGVTLFAGSICRQGASDAMPSISAASTHSALQVAVSPRIQFMLPPTCGAAWGRQS